MQVNASVSQAMPMNTAPTSPESTEGVACPCCGFLTLSERALDEICQVCFWHDDGQDENEADEVWGGPNGSLSLSQGRRNYEAYGAVEPRFKKNVRPPRDEERPRAG